MKKLKGLLVKPYELPEEIELDDSLEAKQNLVGGYIECVDFLKDNNVIFICNEEGKINGMPLNRDIGYDIIAGPFLILGNDYENGDFKSLTDNQIMHYKKVFDKDSIDQTEKKILSIILNKQKKDYER
ncbi:MAG: DUF3846 domain-containing protein [Clostridia bacterium]|nr:DUF3846 domain-containing protein [Clostridia bacterium]